MSGVIKDGYDIGGGEQVGHVERTVGTIGRCPVRLMAQKKRVRSTLIRPMITSARFDRDRPEALPVGGHMRFPQEVEPQRRSLVEVEGSRSSSRPRPIPQLHRLSDALADGTSS